MEFFVDASMVAELAGVMLKEACKELQAADVVLPQIMARASGRIDGMQLFAMLARQIDGAMITPLHALAVIRLRKILLQAEIDALDQAENHINAING